MIPGSFLPEKSRSEWNPKFAVKVIPVRADIKWISKIYTFKWNEKFQYFPIIRCIKLNRKHIRIFQRIVFRQYYLCAFHWKAFLETLESICRRSSIMIVKHSVQSIIGIKWRSQWYRASLIEWLKSTDKVQLILKSTILIWSHLAMFALTNPHRKKCQNVRWFEHWKKT